MKLQLNELKTIFHNKDYFKNSRVKNPKHYNEEIETWDYIYSKDMTFFEGNIIKYVSRWRKKNGIEDLKKAKQYLDKLIHLEETK